MQILHRVQVGHVDLACWKNRKLLGLIDLATLTI